jgi:hypothetical protein
LGEQVEVELEDRENLGVALEMEDREVVLWATTGSVVVVSAALEVKRRG